MLEREDDWLAGSVRVGTDGSLRNERACAASQTNGDGVAERSETGADSRDDYAGQCGLANRHPDT